MASVPFTRRITDDDRPIISLETDSHHYQKNRNGITAITPYLEHGEMGYVVWFAIFSEDFLAQRINGKFVVSIVYGINPADVEEDIPF